MLVTHCFTVCVIYIFYRQHPNQIYVDWDTTNESNVSESDSAFELDFESDVDDCSTTGEQSSCSSTQLPAPILQLFYFCVVWQFFYKISNGVITALFRFLMYLCFAFGTVYNCEPLRVSSKQISV